MADAPSASPTPSSARQSVDTALRELLPAQATWRTPRRLPVATSSEIGLGIGAAAGNKLATSVPAGEESSVGEVKVGPTVRVRLIGDGDDVVITPNDAINSGTGSDVAMVFTWYVWPKHPAEALRLTAHMEVPLPGGGYWSTDPALTKQVPNRPGYIAYSFFHNVATWVSLSGAVTGLLLWLGAHGIRRRQGGEDQLVALDELLVGGRPVTVHRERRNRPSRGREADASVRDGGVRPGARRLELAVFERGCCSGWPRPSRRRAS
jgi:hypothetical protein